MLPHVGPGDGASDGTGWTDGELYIDDTPAETEWALSLETLSAFIG